MRRLIGWVDGGDDESKEDVEMLPKYLKDRELMDVKSIVQARRARMEK